jgi:hypothetical protein
VTNQPGFSGSHALAWEPSSDAPASSFLVPTRWRGNPVPTRQRQVFSGSHALAWEPSSDAPASSFLVPTRWRGNPVPTRQRQVELIVPLVPCVNARSLLASGRRQSLLFLGEGNYLAQCQQGFKPPNQTCPARGGQCH